MLGKILLFARPGDTVLCRDWDQLKCRETRDDFLADASLRAGAQGRQLSKKRSAGGRCAADMTKKGTCKQ